MILKMIVTTTIHRIIRIRIQGNWNKSRTADSNTKRTTMDEEEDGFNHARTVVQICGECSQC